MSGARLPITAEPQRDMVLVGRSPALDKLNLRIPFDDLGPEGFALKTAGRHLVIAGGRLRGSMYGVYGFLEKLGCRWFTADVSRIPKMRTITVAALDETQKPAFEYREPFFAEASDADWAARNKANGSIQKLDAARGGKVQYYPFVHSFNSLVSPAVILQGAPRILLAHRRQAAQRAQPVVPDKSRRAPHRHRIGGALDRRAPRYQHHLRLAERLVRLVRMRQLPAGGRGRGRRAPGPAAALCKRAGRRDREEASRQADRYAGLPVHRASALQSASAEERAHPPLSDRRLHRAPLRTMQVQRVLHEEPAGLVQDHRPALYLALQHQLLPLPAPIPRLRRTGRGHPHVQTPRRGGPVHGRRYQPGGRRGERASCDPT